MVAYIEQQEDCKVIYETGSIQAMQAYVENTKERMALCILSDDYGHQNLLKLNIFGHLNGEKFTR